MQRHARSKIKWFPPAPRNADFPFEVALMADSFTKIGRQMSRVDDRVVYVPGIGALLPPLLRVQFTRSVAALAANCHPPGKERKLEAIARVLDGLDVIAMAEHALRLDSALKCVFGLFIARREIPALIERIPGDR